MAAEGADAEVVDPERDDAHPGEAVEGVDEEAWREERCDLVSGYGPVREEEVAPVLGHAPWPRGKRVRSVFERGEDSRHLKDEMQGMGCGRVFQWAG